MRVLLLNQFYPPDPAPTGTYLRDLARAMVEQGHEVYVLCSRRAYDGGRRYLEESREDGVSVLRLASTGFGRRGFLGKVADYATFGLSLARGLAQFRPRPDLILSLTTPPYLGLAARLAAKNFRCRHAHWVMDLYPDVLCAHGMLRKGGVVCSTLERLTRLQFCDAAAVIALGAVMAERVGCYGVHRPVAPTGKATEARTHGATWVSAVPLWSFDDLQGWPHRQPNPLRAERCWREDELVVQYSGNMGLGHRMGEFLIAAERLGSSGPRWVFAGGGKRRAEVERFRESHPAARIELLDYVPAEILNAHLCAADVHLASLDSGWQGAMVPSKLQASFAVGRPVLFVGGRDNETAKWIEESGGGWIVGENDVDGLMRAIQQARNPAERFQRGEAAQAFARAHFDRTTNCRQLVRLLTQV